MAPMFDTSLSVILPAYNEEENMRRNLPPLLAALEGLVSDFEIIVVDDGSTDSTAAIVEEFIKRDPRIRLVKHGANRGPGSGFVTGMPLAAKELVTGLPADLAVRLDQLDRFLEASRGAEIVVGVSSDRTDYTMIRKLSSAVYVLMIRLLFGLKLRQINYIHFYRRAALMECLPEVSGVFVSAEILIKARDRGFRIAEVDVDYVPREFGTASCGKPGVIFKTIGDALRYRFRRRAPAPRNQEN